MRLADFIDSHVEAILAEWVAFAATTGPAGRAMDLWALRDHAAEMLAVIAADLRTPQTEREQEDKSKGMVRHDPAAPDTAAQIHGAGRAKGGFSVGEMVSEYRALRASVIRLWAAAKGSLTGADLGDLMRFNEAIDQAIAESIERYTLDLDRSRELFLAILGHDLRSPLDVVTMASQFMLETDELVEPHRSLTALTLRSARRMSQMVSDLLDFTRSRLGGDIPIARKPMDLARETALAVDEIMVAHPGRVVQVETSGDLRGAWDSARVGQVLANMLGNAMQHGAPDVPIKVDARGEANEVVLRIQNRGPAIASSSLDGIFSPFKRLRSADTAAAPENLGLGLYIAERIVTAHGGRIEVDSSIEKGTAFTIRLPR